MNAYIEAISYCLPERIVTNEDIIREFPEWSVEKIASKVGVNKRHVAVADETAVDLAIEAAERLFAQGKVDRNEIDYLLFCTQSPDYLLPSSACIIQEHLRLRKNIGALDFNLGCSGYVYGLSLAKGLICGRIAGKVLLLTGETYNKHLHPRDKGNRTIFGDAASATVISMSGFASIGNFSLGTDGSGAENLIIRSGGMRCAEKCNDLSFDENGNPHSSDFLYMNGSEIFTFTLDNVPPLVEDTLLCNGIQKEKVDLFVFHQANKYMLDFLRKKIKIVPERFYYCLSEYGNTVSNTIPIALCEAMTEKRIGGDMKVLIAGFGVGYSWGGTVLHFS
ncbi:ketoacyl-ACP synthase III [Bacteroides sp. GD17]|jgi:3-oxoacyl-[acyl-carrier-protein] synthase-3|uniref:3-oxoacyl-ACP synthase III family protein n=1 Tax=Bacteroides sp. GD17 TaxID=3139826 RepID=UPI0025CDF269|nr:ketoacyl-ACP synthase III [uncultured Bacteroides sp.]